MGFFKKVINSPTKVLDPVGDMLNGLTGVNSQTDKTYKQQMSAMNAQNAYNMQMWNLQNQYNTPMAQLARMAEVGIDINPTSYALGTGNLSNTAALVGSAGGFSGSGSPAGNPISMLMGVAQGIQGVKESKARTDMDDENTKILRHNLKYAQDHNLPVGSVPGLDATVAAGVNKGLTYVKNIPQVTKNVVKGSRDIGYSHGRALRELFFGK